VTLVQRTRDKQPISAMATSRVTRDGRIKTRDIHSAAAVHKHSQHAGVIQFMANQNAEYYFQDLTVLIFQVCKCLPFSAALTFPISLQVENELFKVPRQSFIQHSEVFRNMFSMPIPEGTEPDGFSDKKPLVLQGVETHDFIQLLRYLYPL
jgi:hypothetical protein